MSDSQTTPDYTMPEVVFTQPPGDAPTHPPGSVHDTAPGEQLSLAAESHPENSEIAAEIREILDSKIMIIDDEQLVIRVVRRFLASEGYSNFTTLTDSRRALDAIADVKPDLILLDIMMPEVNGLELLKKRRTDVLMQHVPVIILSASADKDVKLEALNLGATEFLSKPVDPIDLVLRVKNALLVKRHQDHLLNYASGLEEQVRRRTAQIERSREQIVHCLAKAAEFRDNETGQHVIRVGKYAGVIAKRLGFGPNYCQQIELAAQLHDVGKIGIPDSILLHPGKLSTDEFEVMKLHCQLGCQIMEPLANDEVISIRRALTSEERFTELDDSSLLILAGNIARTHHEKWDGTGYPAGLKGEEIPIEGRITCVADVYDALCSERPYKKKFPLEKCLEIMMAERGTRFDPRVLDAFFEKLDSINEIKSNYEDGPGDLDFPNASSML